MMYLPKWRGPPWNPATGASGGAPKGGHEPCEGCAETDMRKAEAPMGGGQEEQEGGRGGEQTRSDADSKRRPNTQESLDKKRTWTTLKANRDKHARARAAGTPDTPAAHQRHTRHTRHPKHRGHTGRIIHTKRQTPSTTCARHAAETPGNAHARCWHRPALKKPPNRAEPPRRKGLQRQLVLDVSGAFVCSEREWTREGESGPASDASDKNLRL